MTDPRVRAIQLLEKATAAKPDDPDIQRKLLKAYLQVDRFDQAVACFATIVELRPLWSQYHFESLVALESDGLMPAFYQALQTVDPERVDDEVMYYTLGMSCQILDELDGAVAAFERGVRAYPDSALLHYNLGVALYKMDPARSQEHHERAVRIAPRMAEPHYALAVRHLRDDIPRARREFQTYIELAEPYLAQYVNSARSMLQLLDRMGGS